MRLERSFSVRIYWKPLVDSISSNCKESGADFTQIMNEYEAELLTIKEVREVNIHGFITMDLDASEPEDINAETDVVDTAIQDITAKYLAKSQLVRRHMNMD